MCTKASLQVTEVMWMLGLLSYILRGEVNEDC